MTYCGKKTSKHGLLILSLVVLLSGCGMETSSEDSSKAAQTQGTTGQTVEIAGVAMKGVIQGGRVTARNLVANQDGYYETGFRAGWGNTEDDGSYSLKLRHDADGWAHLELEARWGTRMICDVLPECDQPQGGPVAFGQPMDLDRDFRLTGVGNLGEVNVNLTPLTHLATALAQRSPSGLSPESVASAYRAVEGWFGLADGAMHLDPPDLTRLDELDGVAADALQVAIANAAFLALVNNNAQWDSISDVINNATVQVSETGQVSIMGDGTSVALADLVAAAAVQASDLQVTVDSSVISQKLVVVEYRNVQRFKTIAEVYGDTDTSVADTTTDSTGDTSTDSTTDTVADTGTDSTAEPDADTAPDSTTDTVADTTTDSTTEPDADTAPDSTTDTVADTTTDSTTDSVADTSEPAPTDTVPANAALLSWTAPLTRENGESLALSEIAGFEVVYGPSAENLDQSLAIGDSSVEELLVDELTEGTWYFAIRTLDTDGNRSRLSDVVFKQI